MDVIQGLIVRFTLVAFAAIVPMSAPAQQITGTPGSPGATTTIDGKLPAAARRRSSAARSTSTPTESKPCVAAARRAAQGRAERAADHDRRRRLRRARAPSAASSRRRRWTGSPRWACATRSFHSTALCSPTRAALITGRNHHSVGFGVVSEHATGFPGYDSIIGKDNGHHRRDPAARTATRTSWFGKNHNTPAFDGEPGRAVRPVADRHGLRVLLRLRRRRHQPVAAEPVPQHHARSTPTSASPAGT